MKFNETIFEQKSQFEKNTFFGAEQREKKYFLLPVFSLKINVELKILKKETLE